MENFISEFDKGFFVFLSVFLAVDFLIFSSILRNNLKNEKSKTFFIFWAVVTILPILYLLFLLLKKALNLDNHCGGEECLGRAILLGLSFLILIPNLIIPPFVLLLFKLFRIDKFWKVIVATLIFGCIVFGILFGLKVWVDKNEIPTAKDTVSLSTKSKIPG